MSAALSPNVKNQSQGGWQASLTLSFEKGPERTVVRRKHIGPLSIQRPFFPEKSVAHVYILHPPGGVVGGDRLCLDASSEDGASGLVTTPGATKFYRSKKAASVSKFSQLINAKGGSLEWFPQENIFFNGCRTELSTTLHVSADAAIALWDIQCFGRPAAGERFQSGSVVNQLKVFEDSAPIFFDRLVINEEYPLSQRSGMGDHPVLGTLLLNKMSKDAVDHARKALKGMPNFFVTLVDSLLIVRYIGDSAEQNKFGFIRVWKQLRCLLNQQHPCVPRIWAT